MTDWIVPPDVARAVIDRRFDDLIRQHSRPVNVLKSIPIPIPGPLADPLDDVEQIAYSQTTCHVGTVDLYRKVAVVNGDP